MVVFSFLRIGHEEIHEFFASEENHLFCVGMGREPGLVRGGWCVDAAFEEVFEEVLEAFGVTF